MTIGTPRAVLAAPGVVAAVLGPGSISCGEVWMTSADLLVSPQVIVSSPDGISCVDPDMSTRNRNIGQRHGFAALLKEFGLGVDCLSTVEEPRFSNACLKKYRIWIKK